MIVNLQSDGWEVIYHRAHALLAAQIAGQWSFTKNDSRVYETIAAISHHDHLEKEWEEDQLTEAGAPLDFTLERETGLDKLRQHVKNSLYQGRWVALLISRHLCFLNQGKQDDPEVADFLAEQRALQSQWRAELDISKDDFEAAYTFMRWCDRLSLILCQKQAPVGGRKLEITEGPDGRDYYILQTESGNLTVTPWPFTCDRFTATIDACYLSQLKFDSNAALNAALEEAPRQVLSWTLKRTDETAD